MIGVGLDGITQYESFEGNLLNYNEAYPFDCAPEFHISTRMVFRKVGSGIVEPPPPPFFTSDNSFDLYESDDTSQFVVRVVTSDITEGNLVITIVGGADQDKFTYIPQTLSLRLTSATDFENPADANGDNTYEVILRVTNDLTDLYSEQTIEVHVLDAYEISYTCKTDNIFKRRTALPTTYDSLIASPECQNVVDRINY